MTPKEKAQQIFDNIFQILVQRGEHHYTFDYAKQCAVIAVDEILKQCWDYRDIDLQSSYDYWQEVKQEINKIQL
jgi:hypothetical protein